LASKSQIKGNSDVSLGYETTRQLTN